MTSVKWIKITTDMFDDEKIKVIQSMPEGDSLLIIWIKLIILAGKTNDGGYIYISDNIPYTDEILSIIMNKPLSIIQLAINTFIKLGMLENDEHGIYLVNFEKHQSLDKLERMKEMNRKRVANFRARQKQKMLENKCNVTSNDLVMQSNAIDIDIDKDIDIYKEEIYKEESISCNIYDYYQNNIGSLTSFQFQAMDNFRKQLSDEMIMYAIEKACDRNAKNFSYIKSILNNWINQGFKTLGDVKNEIQQSKIKTASCLSKQPEEEKEELTYEDRKEFGIA